MGSVSQSQSLARTGCGTPWLGQDGVLPWPGQDGVALWPGHNGVSPRTGWLIPLPPARSRWGPPGQNSTAALAMRRAVCLLSSRRRTVLLLHIAQDALEAGECPTSLKLILGTYLD